MRRGAKAGLAAAAFAIFLAPGALAQEEGGPLRFLKPWLDRQLYGEERAPDTAPEPPTIEPDAAAAEPAVPEPAAPPAEAEPARLEAPPPAMSEPSGDDAARSEPPVVPPKQAGSAPGPEKAEPPAVALRFAVLAGRDVSATMRAIGPMADELQQVLSRPVEILPMSSYAAMIDAQIERRVDGGFYSAASFAEADARCDCLEPLVAPKAADGTLAFRALIVARNDSGIDSAEDLQGKVVAMGASDSIGARRVQLAGLLETSIDPAAFFGAVVELESPEAAVRSVMSGSADAAFAWSSLSGNQAGGYSRGTLAGLVAAGEIAMDEVAIVWRSPPIAHGPFAVLSVLPEADKERIAAYLLTLYARNPAAYDALSPFYPGGYANVDAPDYGGLSLLTTMNVDAIRLPVAPAATAAPRRTE